MQRAPAQFIFGRWNYRVSDIIIIILSISGKNSSFSLIFRLLQRNCAVSAILLQIRLENDRKLRQYLITLIHILFYLFPAVSFHFLIINFPMPLAVRTGKQKWRSSSKWNVRASSSWILSAPISTCKTTRCTTNRSDGSSDTCAWPAPSCFVRIGLDSYDNNSYVYIYAKLLLCANYSNRNSCQVI